MKRVARVGHRVRWGSNDTTDEFYGWTGVVTASYFDWMDLAVIDVDWDNGAAGIALDPTLVCPVDCTGKQAGTMVSPTERRTT